MGNGSVSKQTRTRSDSPEPLLTLLTAVIPLMVNYLMVEETWKLAIEAQDRQRALAGAPVGTLSVCQLPGGPSLKIDPQTREAVSLEFCLMLLY